MTTFAQTVGPTPFGFYNSDADFASEADAMIVYVKRRLGDDILSVELSKKQIWLCFEEATTIFGGLVNRYQTKSNLSTLLGQATGSQSTGSAGQSQRYHRETLAFLNRQAEPYAMLAGLGGSYDSTLGYINLTAGTQDYNIYTELKNSSTDLVIFDTLSGSQKTKLSIIEVFHFSPAAAYRFFDSTSAINYLNNEFSFESFTPETMFYVLPVFEDLLRAGQMKLSQQVRRSNYSYKIQGRNLRIFPIPTSSPTLPTKLWIRVMPAPDPLNPAYEDASTYGVSNISNIPYGNLVYSNINSIGKDWIRQYCLALSKEVLGLVRTKLKSIPIPNTEVTLNGDELLQQSKDERTRLEDELREMLDSLTYDKLVEIDATKAENLIRQLKAVPMPVGKSILVG